MALRSLRHILAILAIICVPIGSQSIGEIFTLDSSCDGHDLSPLLADVRTLLASARTATAALQNAKTFPGGSVIRHYMRDATNTWGTKYYSANTLTERSGLNADDRATISEVDGNLANVQGLLDLTHETANGFLGANNAYLSCSDANYRVTTLATDIDPNLPQGTTTYQAYAKPYLFYNPGANGDFVNAQGQNLLVVRPEGAFANLDPASPQARICVPDLTYALFHLGGTLNFQGHEPRIQVTLCPLLFDELRPSLQGVTPAGSDFVERYAFQAGAFIHELLHAFGDRFNDEPFRLTSEPNGPEYSPYGPKAIDGIANKPDEFVGKYSGQGGIQTTNLPDAYRWFCTMCQFPGTKWSSAHPPS